jgi:hypothetical protein
MKTRNPMTNPGVKAKMTETMKTRFNLKHRAGNGSGATSPQMVLHLLTGYEMEYPVSTGRANWKYAMMDLANPQLKIAIECDGRSHNTIRQKNRDRIKEEMLTQLGWIVLRFLNEEILNHGKEVLARIKDVERQRVLELNP